MFCRVLSSTRLDSAWNCTRRDGSPQKGPASKNLKVTAAFAVSWVQTSPTRRSLDASSRGVFSPTRRRILDATSSGIFFSPSQNSSRFPTLGTMSFPTSGETAVSSPSLTANLMTRMCCSIFPSADTSYFTSASRLNRSSSGSLSSARRTRRVTDPLSRNASPATGSLSASLCLSGGSGPPRAIPHNPNVASVSSANLTDAWYSGRTN